MRSLRRELSSDPQVANVTSKVFIRSTKSGKVQKIVRELYLRQDIPCSSKLCSLCPTIAPADANGNSKLEFLEYAEADR
jgi:exosome complex exonuclease DIS3/RRP44